MYDKRQFLHYVIYCILEGTQNLNDAEQYVREVILKEYDTSHIRIGRGDVRYIKVKIKDWCETNQYDYTEFKDLITA